MIAKVATGPTAAWSTARSAKYSAYRSRERCRAGRVRSRDERSGSGQILARPRQTDARVLCDVHFPYGAVLFLSGLTVLVSLQSGAQVRWLGSGAMLVFFIGCASASAALTDSNYINPIVLAVAALGIFSTIILRHLLRVALSRPRGYLGDLWASICPMDLLARARTRIILSK